MSNRKEWEDTEVNFLIENYAKLGRTHCAEVLSRSINSVTRKAHKLGLSMDKEIRSKMSREGGVKASIQRVKDRTGETSKNYQGYTMTVISSNGAVDLKVQFDDSIGSIRQGISYKEFKKGAVKNLFHPDVYGTGFFGDGQYTARVGGKMTKCYITWVNILGRCYKDSNKRAAYECVIICQEWHNFQNFAKWHEENYKPEVMEGWHIDKDILCYECKEYSPENCCFVPAQINTLFSKNNQSVKDMPKGVHKACKKYSAVISKYGIQNHLGVFTTAEEAHSVYMQAKAEYVKDAADKWRLLVGERVYEAMMSFDITKL